MIRSSLTLYIVLLMIPAALCLKIHYLQESYSVSQFTRVWSDAQRQSAKELRLNLTNLFHDSALQIAVSERKMNTLTQRLNGKIRHGHIEALGLMTFDCQTFVQAHIRPFDPGPCPLDDDDRSTWDELLYDQDHKVSLRRSWLRVKVNSQSYWAYGAVAIDRAWWQRFPNLSSAEQNETLNWSPEPRYNDIALTKGNRSQNLYLKSSWIMAQIWPALKPDGFHPIINGAVLLFLILASLILIAREQFDQRQSQYLKNIYLWLKELNQAPIDQIKLPELQIPTGKNVSVLHQIQWHTTELLSRLLSHDRQQQDILAKFQKRQSQLRQELDSLHLTLAEVPYFESLAFQIESQSQFLTKSLRDHQSLTEDMGDVLEHSVSSDLQSLREILSSWRDGLKMNTPRTFLRHLSERPRGSSNELLYQLDQLFNLAEKLTCASINLMMQSRKSCRKADQLVTYFDHHWAHATSHDHKRADIATDLVHLTEIACKMVHSQIAPFRFQIQATKTLPSIDYLHIPQFVFQALFYYSLLYLFHALQKPNRNNQSPSPFKITIDSVKINNRVHLIFDGGPLPLWDTNELPFAENSNKKVNAVAQQFLAQAERLLRGLPLRLTTIPTLNDRLVVAISWSIAGHDSTVGSTTKDRHEQS